MKYKIQTAAAFGWADLKSSFDDGKTYEVEEYATIKEAQEEINDIVFLTDDSPSDYRIVTTVTPQDGDLYN